MFLIQFLFCFDLEGAITNLLLGSLAKVKEARRANTKNGKDTESASKKEKESKVFQTPILKK